MPIRAIPAPAVVRQEEAVVMTRSSVRDAEGTVVADNFEEARTPVPGFTGPVARTRVSLGVTRSIGHFEFARVDIMVELPCEPTPEAVQAANEAASAQASDFLSRELDTIQPSVPVARIPQRANMSALIHD